MDEKEKKIGDWQAEKSVNKFVNLIFNMFIKLTSFSEYVNSNNSIIILLDN